MSDQDIGLELQERTVIRKGLGKLRAEGFIPAVIHDHGKPSVHVMSQYQKLAKVYEQAGKHHPVQLSVGNSRNLAIIKDVSYDPVKNRIFHVVFQAIRQDEKVETEVPVVVFGDIPAEKAGLLVITHLSHVEVEALPKDLPDELKVDAGKLVEIGDKINVSDLDIPVGVTLLTEPETLIASVEESKAQLAEEAAAEEAQAQAEAAEGEGGEETEGGAESGEEAKAEPTEDK
ncbi:MAG TPA: 50S ribosomal protein L25 [Candidatus Saccharimonadales bacterium]|nr:50S ribosomal protein L25 [Candidatus Saccharimonadales bacterium]